MPVTIASQAATANVAAEREILGGLVWDADLFPVVKDIVEPGDFDSPALKMIAEHVWSQGGKCTPGDVYVWLESRGFDAGHPIALAFDPIAQRVWPAGNVRASAAIVRRLAIKRRVSRMFQDFGEAAQCTDDLSELTREAEATLRKLAAEQSELTLGEIDPNDICDLTALETIYGEAKWAWEKWLVQGHLAIVAAEPGAGKTRFAMDLIRRVYKGLPNPCGGPWPWEKGTRSVWVPSDFNPAELVKIAKEHGLPGSAVVTTMHPDDVTVGVTLCSKEDIARLEAVVRKVRPAFIVVDTISAASGSMVLYRPEDAARFFRPLIAVASRYKCTILALAHLSRSGEALDRRIMGYGRTCVSLSIKDTEDTMGPRVLKITKSYEAHPPALEAIYSPAGATYQESDELDEEDQSPREQVQAEVLATLYANGGRWTPRDELAEAVAKAGIASSDKTLQRALKALETSGAVERQTAGRLHMFRPTEDTHNEDSRPAF